MQQIPVLRGKQRHGISVNCQVPSGSGLQDLQRRAGRRDLGIYDEVYAFLRALEEERKCEEVIGS